MGCSVEVGLQPVSVSAPGSRSPPWVPQGGAEIHRAGGPPKGVEGRCWAWRAKMRKDGLH